MTNNEHLEICQFCDGEIPIIQYGDNNRSSISIWGYTSDRYSADKCWAVNIGLPRNTGYNTIRGDDVPDDLAHKILELIRKTIKFYNWNLT